MILYAPDRYTKFYMKCYGPLCAAYCFLCAYVFQPYPEIESPGIDIEAKYFLWKFHQAKGFQGKRRMKNIN